MMTIQKIQHEIVSLPEEILQEVLDFVLFLKTKRQEDNLTGQKEISSSERRKREQWLKTLPELPISKREQISIAQARKEEREEMTIEQFQVYLNRAGSARYTDKTDEHHIM